MTLPVYFPHCRFVFPTGAPRETTVFGGKKTNAWFDIADFSDRTKGEVEMIKGMRDSTLYLSRLIKDEIELLYDGEERRTKGKVMLLGFSQGSAMGMMLLLGGELQRMGVSHGFGGFVGLSGWLPFRRQIQDAILDGFPKTSTAEDSGATHGESAMIFVRKLLGLDLAGQEWRPTPKAFDVPILLAHGELDRKVRLEWGTQLRDVLQTLGNNVSLKTYHELAHWWSEDEMRDVAEFLDKRWQGKEERSE
ncbi:hypothetical protein LZ554_003096 [Drepanopeziza brunnea f. sp. 'monogermtubi']|nr:hypothetical protein LZ554_003096 [Drepanopeziza brunnea f. sp. 'monogermtubi']